MVQTTNQYFVQTDVFRKMTTQGDAEKDRNTQRSLRILPVAGYLSQIKSPNSSELHAVNL